MISYRHHYLQFWKGNLYVIAKLVFLVSSFLVEFIYELLKSDLRCYVGSYRWWTYIKFAFFANDKFSILIAKVAIFADMIMKKKSLLFLFQRVIKTLELVKVLLVREKFLLLWDSYL